MKQPVRRFLIDRWRIAACGTSLVAASAVAAPMGNVMEELERLMEQHGFEVRGIEQTAESEGRVEGETLVARLRVLLDDFDHVIVQEDDGGVERVIILGEKVAAITPDMYIEPGGIGFPDEDLQAMEDEDQSEPGDLIVLPTQRQGTSHAVDVTLEGPNRQRIEQTLLIDTGSDHVVLPASLIAPLGIQPPSLRTQTVQTANGTVQARIGTLEAIWLGDHRIQGISVAFIEDSRLGGNALLGMSLLGRYLVTIDDDLNQLTLAAR
jgi:clan AA aspartic protease (TIGR02281 family)